MIQWLALDQITDRPIQYHRFENDRMSISSKMVSYHCTSVLPRACPAGPARPLLSA